jgi:hypothetical protein
MAADKDKKADKPKKGKKGKKGDDVPRGAEPGAQSSGAPSVAAHPRAARAVGRAKGWGALLGFLLGGYLSLPTNTLVAAGLHALAAGAVCYVAVWGGAVFLWRRLVMLEIKGREQRLLAGAGLGAAKAQGAAQPKRPSARTS